MTDQERLAEIKSIYDKEGMFYGNPFGDWHAFETEVGWLIDQAEQVHALKCELGRLKASTKNKERARRRKDNYINRMQNQLIAIKEVNKKRNQQLEQARETLDFYADNENYKTTNHELLGECLPEIIYDDGANARQTLEELK